MTMTAIQDVIGNAIPFYARSVAMKSPIEMDDAKQELSIVAWQTATIYEECGSQELTLEQFLMTKLYWESQTLIRNWYRKEKSEQKVIAELKRNYKYSYNPEIDWCNEIAFKQELDRLPQIVSTVLKHRRLGDTIEAIARRTGYTNNIIRRILQKY